MIDIKFLTQLKRFDLIMRKRITSNLIGERKSKNKGRGIIFHDHRIYSKGDDFKAIDWKVYARTDNLYIKNYEEERNLTVHIVVDSSASMNYGGKIKKFDYASMIGIGFAYLAMHNNEKFVLSTFSENLEVFRPKKGMAQLADIVDYLNNKKAGGKSKFEGSLAEYKKLINTKSLVIIISDFLYPPKEVERVIYRFKKNRIKLVQVLDPTEVRLSVEGDFKLRDLEDNAIIKTFISPFMKKKYQEKLDNHNEELISLASKVGANYYTVNTDTPVFNVFYDILD